MIEVRYDPKRNAVKVVTGFHCKHQYVAEVYALFDAITRSMDDKELFVMLVQERLNQLQKEMKEVLKDDKNNTGNESDQ